MSGDAGPAPDALKRAVAPMVAAHPGVVVGASRTGDGTKECLVLTVESGPGPCRYLRIHSVDEFEYPYAWLFSSYRAEDPAEVLT